MSPCCIVVRPVKLFFSTSFLFGRAVEALQDDIVMNQSMESLPSPTQFNSLYEAVSIRPMSQREKDHSNSSFTP